jgi:tRNA threonylcarbamoyl adenosine modification protein YeaZ
MLLAIDTSAGTSVAAQWRDGAAEAASTSTMAHAEVVGQLISEVIEASGLPVSRVTGVVAGIGPGPFTGLRVGLAAASAFAVGRDVPLLPVVSHDAIAFDALEEIDGPVLVVTDARRKELYWSIYRGFDANGLPERVAGPALAKPDELPTEWDGAPVTRWDAAEVSAGLLNLIAHRKLEAGIPFEPFEPLYLRSPDVTLSNGPKRVVQ